MTDDGSMTRTFETVLFDLDGTLVDSASGILGSLHAAFDELGLEHERAALGRHLLGPPLHATLPRIIDDPETAAAAVSTYRRHYGETGVYDCAPYPGIDALLAALRDAGMRVALATSKADVYAERIVAHHGWEDHFVTVVGDTLDAGRPTKAAVVGEALRRLGSPDPAGVVMVGDRSNDVAGSRAHGVGCLGVAWGYAEPGELADAGALTVLESVADLAVALSVTADRSVPGR